MRQEQAHQKWVIIVFLVFGVLAGFLSGKLIEYGIYNFNLQRKIRHIFIYGQLLSVGIGVLTFVFFLNYVRFRKYIQEVVTETIKVSWPVKKEVVATTIVVIIGVIIAGAFLGVFDHLFSILMRWVVTR